MLTIFPRENSSSPPVPTTRDFSNVHLKSFATEFLLFFSLPLRQISSRFWPCDWSQFRDFEGFDGPSDYFFAGLSDHWILQRIRSEISHISLHPLAPSTSGAEALRLMNALLWSTPFPFRSRTSIVELMANSRVQFPVLDHEYFFPPFLIPPLFVFQWGWLVPRNNFLSYSSWRLFPPSPWV